MSSYQAPVYNQGYFDVPIHNAYSNANPMCDSYPSVTQGDFNNQIQQNFPMGGYTVQPSNLETFVGSRESSFKYIGNSGYNTNPYMMSINHSNDQFPAQVYTNTGVQLRVDPRMSSSKIEDSAYKAKSQMMGGGYGQQFLPNNPFTMPQMGMNYYNPSAGYASWSFEPPYSEPYPTFPAVPAQMPLMPNMTPMMSGPMMMNGPMMNGPMNGQMGGRPTPNIRIQDADDESEGSKSTKSKRKRKVKDSNETPIENLDKDTSTMGKINSFLTDNNTVYWLIVLFVILIVAFVIKAVYVDK